MKRIVLASSSPRRSALLRQIGLQFDVIVPTVDEEPLDGESPIELVERLAAEKAENVAEQVSDSVVIGADTMVFLDNNLLSKPVDEDDAIRMLTSLSGQTHVVYTGYSVIDTATGRNITSHATAEVTFRELKRDEIHAYVATGSPLDKAGSYGIQDDFGAVFVEKICGDYYCVIGLPLMRVYMVLKQMDAL